MRERAHSTQSVAVASEAPALSCAAPASAERDFTTLYELEFSYVWHTLRRLGIHDRDLPDVARRREGNPLRRGSLHEGRELRADARVGGRVG